MLHKIKAREKTEDKRTWELTRREFDAALARIQKKNK